jgi:hypothetical protein
VDAAGHRQDVCGPRLDGLSERIDDLRIELGTSAGSDIIERIKRAHRSWAGGEIHKGFGHGNNASFNDDVLASEPLGEPAAVEAFVVLFDDLHDDATIAPARD